jgi:hypothetical protein
MTPMDGAHPSRAAGYAILAVIGAGLLIGLTRIGRSDVRFCREVLEGLVNGRPAVHRRIDWGRLQAAGVDVGTTYSALPNAKERVQYEQAFIANFARGFAQAQGRVSDFHDWRVAAREPGGVVVAADFKDSGRSLLFLVGTQGARKLAALEWKTAAN